MSVFFDNAATTEIYALSLHDALPIMDADGSHHPEQLPLLLAALDDADLVLGSRWVHGGRVEDWPRRRLLLSRVGNLYTRWALRLPLADSTGGVPAGRGGVRSEEDKS